MTTIEDRYYQQPETPDTEEKCRYENPDGIECGEEAAYLSEVLCPTHLDQLDAGVISWDEYRAIQAHYEIA